MFRLLTALLFALPAHALSPVADFGDNPGTLIMHLHLPPAAGLDAPVLVLLHGCLQDASAFAEQSGWIAKANAEGFILVVPEQTLFNNATRCFNWFDAADVSADQGELASILDMLTWVQSRHTTEDTAYVVGLSAGASMAGALLAVAPDRFRAGALFSGTPVGCAVNVFESGGCLTGVDRTPEAWAEAVHAAAGTPNAEWPRVLAVQGAEDAVVALSNLNEVGEQWAAVHGLTNFEGHTDGALTWRTWGDAVHTLQIAGMGHGFPVAPMMDCGTAGLYLPDVMLCGAQVAWDFFNPSPASITPDMGVDMGPFEGGLLDMLLPDAGNWGVMDVGLDQSVDAGVDALPDLRVWPDTAAPDATVHPPAPPAADGCQISW